MNRVRLVLVVVGLGWALPVVAAPTREARITIARGTNNGAPATGADAAFGSPSTWGKILASDGPCTIYRHAPEPGLSVGTIEITGTATPITLAEVHAPTRTTYRRSASGARTSFSGSAPLTVQAAGGSDVPAFSASVIAPETFAGYTAPRSLPLDGYTARWTPGPGPEIRIVVGALDGWTPGGTVVVCSVPDTGSFTVPASTLQWIPPGDQAVLMVGRVAETVQIVGDTRVVVDAYSYAGSGPLVFARQDRAIDELSSSRLLMIGSGFGGWSRSSSVAPNRGTVLSIQLGQRLRPRLHLIEEFTGADGAFSPDPTITEDHGAILVGLRWSPVDARRERMRVALPVPTSYFDEAAHT